MDEEGEGTSGQPKDWERIIQRGKTAGEAALRKLATNVVAWLEEWERPKEPSYRGSLLTEKKYNAMLERQAGVCAICAEKPKGGRLAVDHIHGTETVRGLLCGRCNTALGLFKDDPERLAVAIKYLRRARAATRRRPTAKDEGNKLGLADAYLRGKNQKPG